MKLKIALRILVGVMLFFVLTAASSDIENAVSSLADKKTGWELNEQRKTESGIAYRLSNDHWLMFFLHWRPLDKTKENLDFDFVKKLLFNFWGPEMPFKLTGEEGEMKISGHHAYYVVATIYDGAVKTKFIVWNCPETGRQMIADTNINKSLGTPEELLDLQSEMAKTVSCHKGEAGYTNSLLDSIYETDKYNLSFHLPANWHASDYSDPNWFPSGLSAVNGTLWALPTDSHKFIGIEEFDHNGKFTVKMFKEKFLKTMSGFFKNGKMKLKIEDAAIATIHKEENGFSAQCLFTFHLKEEKIDLLMNYLARAFFIKKNGKGILAIGGMQNITEFWGRPKNLTPSEETFRKFIDKELKPLCEY